MFDATLKPLTLLILYSPLRNSVDRPIERVLLHSRPTVRPELKPPFGGVAQLVAIRRLGERTDDRNRVGARPQHIGRDLPRDAANGHERRVRGDQAMPARDGEQTLRRILDFLGRGLEDAARRQVRVQSADGEEMQDAMSAQA